jgi:hypothetical protein
MLACWSRSRPKAAELPREVLEFQGRIARLRGRLKNGDPDMPADELQAAIDRAEGKRRELEAQQLGENVPMSKALAIMPRQQNSTVAKSRKVSMENPQAAQKARLFLREWFTGNIRLEPLAGSGLMAPGIRTSARSSAPQ